MSQSKALLREFENEAATTRRVLERVPADKLTWQPHPKSMSLGRLAQHVAMSPGVIFGWATQDVSEFGGERPPEPRSTADILAAHDQSVSRVKEVLNGMSDEDFGKSWQATMKGTALMSMPKGALIRAIGMNHIYHHRGQLSVYLRLLDVPVPSIYGPSADENPFAART